jgi:hypothetical protein
MLKPRGRRSELSRSTCMLTLLVSKIPADAFGASDGNFTRDA